MSTPKGCMNKAMDRSIRLKPIVAFTSGIRKSQSDKPSDWVTKNNRSAITGVSRSLDSKIKFIFYTKEMHLEFLNLKFKRLSIIL